VTNDSKTPVNDREQEMNFASQPFSVETEDAPTELQMKLIDLQ